MLVLKNELEKYFKKFDVISILGQGSFGTVYNVQDKTTNEQFALKEIHIKFGKVETFMNELLPPGISHRNILYYSPLMISKRPLKLSELKENTNIVKSRSKSAHNINFYEELNADNLENDYSNVTQNAEDIKNIDNYTAKKYEEFSSSDIFNTKVLSNETNQFYPKAIVDSQLNLKKDISNTFMNKITRKNVRPKILQKLTESKRCKNWGVSNSPYVNKKIKRNNCNTESYFLYLKTKLCSFSLRDFIDARNERLFDKSKENYSNIFYKGILNTNVKIPFELYRKSVTGGGNVCKEFSLRIFKYILLGLIFLHSRGISHNDLKSSNIFLDGSDSYVPKIGDFGSKSMCEMHDLDKNFFEATSSYYNCNITNIQCNHSNSSKLFDCRSLIPILIDLIYPFKTHAEMIGTLRIINKTKKIPNYIRRENFKESELILKILTDDNITVQSILTIVNNILGIK